MHNFKEIFELKTKKTFILGGLGLIGKSLVQGLSEAGSEVLILDQDINRKEKFLSEGSFLNQTRFPSIKMFSRSIINQIPGSVF